MLLISNGLVITPAGASKESPKIGGVGLGVAVGIGVGVGVAGVPVAVAVAVGVGSGVPPAKG